MHILVHDLDEGIVTYQDAINASGSYLLEKDYIQIEYIAACINREKSYPTGLLMSNGIGIAIPHANYQLVKINSISIVRSINGVTFGEMEDSSSKVSCQLIFNLALATSDQHLSILKRLFTLFQDESFLNKCQQFNCKQTEEFIIQQLKL
ncbi:PTS sugar transporter subunit IIA [Gilliamella sp. B2889]|uniref:PTS sugar transporter subunit IIA n=1 Tax=Gilliamella sp. B2889 TaxID=2817985 RepID=UPI002269A7E5|nr:PTS sugar transporter subunit IIA [Gilliamella sp. B2889]MCX8682780.1 PTS sugar transporter subunit IIA [Gilliamella sp. B2889]